MCVLTIICSPWNTGASSHLPVSQQLVPSVTVVLCVFSLAVKGSCVLVRMTTSAGYLTIPRRPIYDKTIHKLTSFHASRASHWTREVFGHFRECVDKNLDILEGSKRLCLRNCCSCFCCLRCGAQMFLSVHNACTCALASVLFSHFAFKGCRFYGQVWV